MSPNSARYLINQLMDWDWYDMVIVSFEGTAPKLCLLSMALSTANLVNQATEKTEKQNSTEI